VVAASVPPHVERGAKRFAPLGPYARRTSQSTTATTPMMARIVMTIPIDSSFVTSLLSVPRCYLVIFRAALPAVS
jgi:hypothetical protein